MSGYSRSGVSGEEGQALNGSSKFITAPRYVAGSGFEKEGVFPLLQVRNGKDLCAPGKAWSPWDWRRKPFLPNLSERYNVDRLVKEGYLRRY